MNQRSHKEQEPRVKAGLKKPSILRQLVPWAIAVIILAFMFHEVNFGKLLEILREADAAMLVGAFLVYSLYYYLTDILSFWKTYKWFNTDISFQETARLRFASYSLQAINGALAEIVTLLYMFRVKRVPVLHATSSALFIYFIETWTLLVLLTYAAFFLPPENRIFLDIPRLNMALWEFFQIIVIAGWLFCFAWVVFWRTKLRDRLAWVRDNNLLMAFKHAYLENYGEVFLYRFSNNLLSVFMNILMLKALGIKAPFALLFAVVPIMVNVAYLPVSAGGFGGPQLVAHYLLKGYATEEAILAYSLAWSALFLLTRVFTGLPFLKTVYRIAFPQENISGEGDSPKGGQSREEFSGNVDRDG